MAGVKYFSLEETRKLGKLDQFARMLPGEGDARLWLNDEWWQGDMTGVSVLSGVVR